MNLAVTNEDATNCRYSCFKKGYIEDPFVEWFADVTAQNSKGPLINRGTYYRTKAIDEAVLKFIVDSPNGQVLSLGAGFDTRYFRLKLKCKYIEIDKEDVVMTKINKLRRHSKKLDLTGTEFRPSRLKSQSLEIIAADVLELNEEILKTLVDLSLPTLVLAECLFVYLDPLRVDKLLSIFAKHKASVLVYDPLHESDSFSLQMVANLNQRGIAMRGFERYKNKYDQTQRFKSLGYKNVDAWTMNNIPFLSTNDIERITKLEIFDEFEEWTLFQTHYHILLANTLKSE